MVTLALVAALSLPVLAKDKDKGVETPFANWGIITVPTDLQMNQGTQEMLTAQRYGNDVTRMLEQIYPVEPVSWQVVQIDQGMFQYGYVLRYSVNLWQVESALQGRSTENAYIRDIGDKPDAATLMSHANNRLITMLPAGWSVVKPFTAKTVKGTKFYEATLADQFIVNQAYFTETIRVISWVHGNDVEIAVVFAHNGDGENLLDTVTDMLEHAKKDAALTASFLSDQICT